MLAIVVEFPLSLISSKRLNLARKSVAAAQANGCRGIVEEIVIACIHNNQYD